MVNYNYYDERSYSCCLYFSYNNYYTCIHVYMRQLYTLECKINNLATYIRNYYYNDKKHYDCF